MEKIVANFLVSNIITDIQNNMQLSDDFVLALDKYPLIDDLRNEILQKDVSWILTNIETQSLLAGNLLIILLKNYSCQRTICSSLISLWKDSVDYKRRLALMWRLLDIPDLDLYMHEEIYEFVKENLTSFANVSCEWLGGKDVLLGSCKARFSDPSFPQTKHWVYLCSSLGSPDVDGIVCHLNEYRTSQNLFTARVATEMLERSENSKRL